MNREHYHHMHIPKNDLYPKTDAHTQQIQNILNVQTGSVPLYFSPKVISKLNFSLNQKETLQKNYLLTLGHNSAEIAYRKFLIEHIPRENSFCLTLYKEILSENFSANLIERCGYTELFKEDDPYKMRNKYHEFLGIIRDESSQATINKFLRDHIKDELLSLQSKGGTKFTDDKGADYFVQVPLISPTRIPVKANYNELKASKSSVNKCLQDIGFFAEDEEITLDNISHIRRNNFFPYSNEGQIKLISNVLDSSEHEGEYNFQRLEFFGDAVANFFVSKFLYEKNIKGALPIRYYPTMISNKMYAEFTKKLGLDKHLEPAPIEVKDYADAFEALIGALVLAFPEERVYEFVRPLLEEASSKLEENWCWEQRTKLLYNEYIHSQKHNRISQSYFRNIRTDDRREY